MKFTFLKMCYVLKSSLHIFTLIMVSIALWYLYNYFVGVVLDQLTKVLSVHVMDILKKLQKIFLFFNKMILHSVQQTKPL